MSQEKVDRKKYEKHHRKEIERKKKVKTATTCVLTAFIVGMLIGIPAGISYYRQIPKFVGDSTLKAFVNNYLEENYANELSLLESKGDDSADTTESEIEQAVESAVGEELNQMDADDLDEMMESEETTQE